MIFSHYRKFSLISALQPNLLMIHVLRALMVNCAIFKFVSFFLCCVICYKKLFLLHTHLLLLLLSFLLLCVNKFGVKVISLLARLQLSKDFFCYICLLRKFFFSSCTEVCNDNMSDCLSARSLQSMQYCQQQAG